MYFDRIDTLISIVVPIYNQEKYISQCIESILGQTYKTIELILVDDGSTDSSVDICLRYAEQDSRIKVVKNIHQGLVATRKSGVEHATGTYCMFVDGDDWICKDALDILVSLTVENNVDILNYNLISVECDKQVKWEYTIPEGVYKGEELQRLYEKMMFDFEYEKPGLIQSLCTKLMKRDLLWKAIKDVDINLTMGEDAAVTYPIMLCAKKVAIINEHLYFYRVHGESMCNTQDIDVFSKIYFFREYMREAFARYDKSFHLQKQLQAYLLHFIDRGMRELFSIRLKAPYHLPVGFLMKGERIIIYGAGKIGKVYHRQLKQEGLIEIVAWIDKALAGQEIEGCMIESPAKLNENDYDKVVIAVKKKESADEIADELSEIVDIKKLLWIEPQIATWAKEIDLGV